MADKRNVPEIRFKGFEGEWEERKLFQAVDVRSGHDYKHLSEGDIPVYGSGGYLLSVNDALSHDEDAIGIGRKGTIDKPSLLKAPFWTVDTLFYAVPKEKYNLHFIFDIFQTIDWKQKDESTGVPSLSKVAINETYFHIPQNEEQSQIGAFFQNLDSLITLHQHKYDKLTTVKKAMLEKMFPKDGADVPEIRFKGFTEKWESKKFGNIFNQRVEYLNPQESNIELWSLTIEKGLTPKTERYVRDFLVRKEDKYKAVKSGDIIFNPMNMTIGAIGYNNMPKTVAVSGYYVTMQPIKNVDGYFILTLMKRPNSIQAYKMSATGTLLEKQRVQYPTFSDIKCILPDYAEQTKISRFFQNLDSLITLQQRELDKLKNIKKACLEKMFV